MSGYRTLGSLAFHSTGLGRVAGFAPMPVTLSVRTPYEEIIITIAINFIYIAPYIQERQLKAL